MNRGVMWTILLVATLVVIVLAWILFATPAPVLAPTTSTSTPRSIETPFMSDKVTISNPLPHATVGKTFTVTGEARGAWYFEASFPVQVRDANNNKVGQGIAQAQGDWMTESFVPFEAAVTVSGYRGPATLVLMKDNPSGLPENDDSVEIPVVIQ